MALVSNPRVLFLDEPTIGLDPQSRRVIWEHIEQLKGQTTIVLTTHYLEEADALADRVAIVDDGTIVALGSPTELKNTIAGAQTTVVEAKQLTADAVAALEADLSRRQGDRRWARDRRSGRDPPRDRGLPAAQGRDRRRHVQEAGHARRRLPPAHREGAPRMRSTRAGQAEPEGDRARSALAGPHDRVARSDAPDPPVARERGRLLRSDDAGARHRPVRSRHADVQLGDDPLPRPGVRALRALADHPARIERLPHRVLGAVSGDRRRSRASWSSGSRRCSVWRSRAASPLVLLILGIMAVFYVGLGIILGSLSRLPRCPGPTPPSSS